MKIIIIIIINNNNIYIFLLISEHGKRGRDLQDISPREKLLLDVISPLLPSLDSQTLHRSQS